MHVNTEDNRKLGPQDLLAAAAHSLGGKIMRAMQSRQRTDGEREVISKAKDELRDGRGRH